MSIVIGTDGIWKTRNAQGEYFGNNRLMSVVGAHADRPSPTIVAAAPKRLNAFRGELPVENECHPGGGQDAALTADWVGPGPFLSGDRYPTSGRCPGRRTSA
jgi:hypothetical protein